MGPVWDWLLGLTKEILYSGQKGVSVVWVIALLSNFNETKSLCYPGAWALEGQEPVFLWADVWIVESPCELIGPV